LERRDQAIAAERPALGAPGLRGTHIMCEATDDSLVEELDVRSLVPAQRHQTIFERVDELAFGASFVLINDHDPKPLYYQLEAEYPHQFSWDYLERGPEVWRVEIGRNPKAGAQAAQPNPARG
jgi:uncharacterized protein (DUF2249 family)